MQHSRAENATWVKLHTASTYHSLRIGAVATNKRVTQPSGHVQLTGSKMCGCEMGALCMYTVCAFWSIQSQSQSRPADPESYEIVSVAHIQIESIIINSLHVYDIYVCLFPFLILSVWTRIACHSTKNPHGPAKFLQCCGHTTWQLGILAKQVVMLSAIMDEAREEGRVATVSGMNNCNTTCMTKMSQTITSQARCY